MTPLTHPAKKIDQMDSENKDVGVVLHVWEEVYQSTLTFRRRIVWYQEWSPWSIQPLESKSKDIGCHYKFKKKVMNHPLVLEGE